MRPYVWRGDANGMPEAEVQARLAEARSQAPAQARAAAEALIRRQFAIVAAAILETGAVNGRQLEKATQVILAAFDACTITGGGR